MKNSMKYKMAVYFVSLLSLLCDVSSPAYPSDLDHAVQLYTGGEFEKSKQLFTRTIRHESPENRQIAFLYLALIEMAYQNMEKADNYLTDLLSANPFFNIEKYSDIISPDFKHRFDRIKSSIDVEKPVGNIFGIRNVYFEGETVDFRIEAQDNRSLAGMMFEVGDASLKQSWNLSGKSANQAWSFPTRKWELRIYAYNLTVRDLAGNTQTVQGAFELRKKPDNTQPKGMISGIRKSYTEGDIIEYSASAEDDTIVKSMTFEVKNTSVKQLWDVAESSVKKSASFSTHNWNPGTYHYTLSVRDDAENSTVIPGTFVLNGKTDDAPPEGKITGILSTYTKGQPIELNITANDNISLQGVTFEISNTPVLISWKSDEKTASYSYSVQTDGWDPDTYTWILSVSDISNNTTTYSGSFELHPNQQFGYLNVVTKPWTDIYIDGKSWGRTPKARLTLPAGQIDIRFVNESEKIDTTETIIIKHEELLEKSFVFKPAARKKKPEYGYLNIFTKPWTEIYIGGQSYGNTPKANLKLPTGRIDIRFVNESEGIDITETIIISPDHLIKKTFIWKK